MKLRRPSPHRRPEGKGKPDHVLHRRLPGAEEALARTRHHGDYHLGQVLVANNDS
jgi:hypothetical protein